MTTDRDFDRIATAWLADGPDELSNRVLDAVVDQIHLTRQRRAMRVPWRFPTMTTPARVAAAAVIGVLVVGGTVLLLGRPGQPAVGGPVPSQSASPVPTASPPVVVTSPSASVVAIPALTGSFASPRHGYTVKHPAGWTATAATKPWTPGTDTLWGDPALDAIGGTEARLSVASQPLAAGQTPDAWQVAYCGSKGATADSCGRAISIGGVTGYVGEDGATASGGTVASGGILFDASVVVGGRGYQFDLDGHVDRALFDALMASVTFRPEDAIDLPALSGTFVSPTYGYGMGTADGWTTKPATTAWKGFQNATPAVDTIAVTGTDTTITGASQVLPGTTTPAAWLTAFHASTNAVVPVGCDGGEPTTWPTIQVGDQAGRLVQLCNAAEAVVVMGNRVYVFDWTNGTFTAQAHLSQASWSELLRSVTFTPGTAK